MRTALPPSFAALTGSNLAAQSAEQLSLAASPIVAVLMLGAGPGEIGLLATAQTLPFLLLSIPFGVAADRLSRRRLMLVCEGLRALSLAGLVLAVASGRLSIGLLALLGFVGAVGTVGFSVAAPALVPSLVPRAQLVQANGRLELARSAAYAAGPALGGALVSWAGASAAFVLATVLSLAALAALWRVHEPARDPGPARHPLVDLREGAAIVWHDRLLRPMLLAALAWNIAWFVLQAAYVPWAARALGLDARQIGFTLAAFGVGMVLGALASRAVMARLHFGQAVLVGPLVSVLAMATMLATVVWPSGWVAGAAFFLFGAGPILWTITTTSLRQSITPGAMLGRVSAIFLAVNAGARPLGAALGGFIGQQAGEQACLAVAMGVFMLQAAIICASAMRGLRTLPQEGGAALPNPR